MRTSHQLRLVLVAATALAASACSGESSGDTDGDGAAPDATTGLLCDDSAGGDPFDLTFGILEGESSYVELVDGDEMTVILGPQGLYMIHLETRALLTFGSEEICFTCLVGVGPTDAGFAGIWQEGPIGFIEQGGDDFAGAFNIILGSPEQSDAYADAEVEVSMDCDGYGFSGAVARSITLRLPQ